MYALSKSDIDTAGYIGGTCGNIVNNLLHTNRRGKNKLSAAPHLAKKRHYLVKNHRPWFAYHNHRDAMGAAGYIKSLRANKRLPVGFFIFPNLPL